MRGHDVLRRNDYALDEDQEFLRESFSTFFAKRSPVTRVREAEPVGWDPELWDELAELRAVAMGVPESAGGDGAGVLELALVCEEAGRRAAPVPLVETVVAARLLAALGRHDAVTRVLEGAVATVALAAPGADGRTLTPAGPIAEMVLGVHQGEVVLLHQDEPPLAQANLGSAPLGWCDLSAGTPIAPATGIASAAREWRLLVAATLVGLGSAALAEGVQYAKDRTAFGVVIGAFQAVAHPLAESASALEGARRLTRKACWFADHDPDALGPLASMAYVHAAESAERAGYVALHTQGGFGFTLESDVQLYYRRAKTWPLLAGDPRAELLHIGRELYGGPS